MFIRLTILFKNIYPNCQIIAATILGNDGPPLFCTQLTDSPGPLFLIFRKVFEFFARDFLADVPSEIFDNSVRHRDLLFPDFVQHIPAVSGFAILLSAHQNVLIRFHF